LANLSCGVQNSSNVETGRCSRVDGHECTKYFKDTIPQALFAQHGDNDSEERLGDWDVCVVKRNEMGCQDEKMKNENETEKIGELKKSCCNQKIGAQSKQQTKPKPKTKNQKPKTIRLTFVQHISQLCQHCLVIAINPQRMNPGCAHGLQLSHAW
jgi:hypothetical protein